ncbi:MAG: 4-(cytidine 5'-diphospho)-2-C-methyl-D-erythritol kinase [Pirellulales bacterium]|jgi:4-diphosphocytidyl-2-C-methyl-D-erythritol kinase
MSIPGLAATPIVEIDAPAKLNLSLGVVARRADGFHEIDSLMVAVTLCDTLQLSPRPDAEFRLRVTFGGRLATPEGQALARDVPEDDRNLAVRAAKALARTAGVTRGLDIGLVKRIPSQAGLGGGSSDAAAVLLAASRVWGLELGHRRLVEIAAELGSDVPWFLTSGGGIATGRGERIEPVSGLPDWPVVIAVPAEGLSTAAVYGGCTPEPDQVGRSMKLAGTMRLGRFEESLELMHNTLQAAAVAASPTVERLLLSMKTAGAVRPMVTGSGSGCFALTPSEEEALAIANTLSAEGWPGVFCGRLAPVCRLDQQILAENS